MDIVIRIQQMIFPIIVLTTLCAASVAFVWSLKSRRIMVLIVASAVASIPFYGYFVHVGRDSQLIALLIILCWFAIWPLAVTSIILAFKHPPASRQTQVTALGLVADLVLAGIIGMGGVWHAINELLAG